MICVYGAYFLLVSFLLIDIRSVFHDGLLLSDDYHYFKNRIPISFDLDDVYRIKNIGYYNWNYYIAKLLPSDPVLAIVISNCLVYVLAVRFYLGKCYTTGELLSFLMPYPIILISSINYKDLLLFSINLIIIKLLQLLFRNRYSSNLILCLPLSILIIFADLLRLGNFVTIFLAIILGVFLKTHIIKKIMLLLVAYGVAIMIILPEVFSLFGRDFWGYVSSRGVSSSANINYFLNFYTAGIFKTVFQYNPLTSLNYYFSDYGEHGFSTLYSKTNFYLFALTYFCSLPFALRGLSMLERHHVLLAYVILNIFVYSSIYGGLIGLRLSFPLSVIVFLCTFSYIERKK